MRVRLVAFSLIAVAVVGCAPAAAASGGLDAFAEAESLSTEGISLLSADLLALLQEAHDLPLSPPAFHLSAASAVVETTVRDPTLHVPGAAVGLDAQTQGEEFHDVEVAGTDARLDDRLDVFPLEGRAPPHLRAETGCTTWTGAGRGEVVREPRVPTSARRTASSRVEGGARVSECGGSYWTVTGDFRILLWERDADLASREGNGSLRSGRLGLAPSAGAARTEEAAAADPVARDQEVYLYVTRGTLRVPMGAATVSYVASDASLEGAAAVTLHRASLRLGEGTRPVQAGSVRLAGDLGVRLLPSGGPVAVRLDGFLDGGLADGAALSAAAVAPAAPLVQAGGLLQAGALGAGLGVALALLAIAFLASSRR